MKSKYLFYLLFIAICSSCKEKNNEGAYNVQADIRFGNKYYSLFFSPDGNSKVIKGIGTYFTNPFRTQTTDSTITFKIDSVSVSTFYDKLETLKNNPIIDSAQHDATRAEIYFEGKKIFDSYKWTENFWDIFRIIMEKIPKAFNPFHLSDNPW